MAPPLSSELRKGFTAHPTHPPHQTQEGPQQPGHGEGKDPESSLGRKRAEALVQRVWQKSGGSAEDSDPSNGPRGWRAGEEETHAWGHDFFQPLQHSPCGASLAALTTSRVLPQNREVTQSSSSPYR